MKVGFLFLGIFLALAGPAGAQQPVAVWQALGYAQIAAGGLASAVNLPSIPNGARMALICAEAQAVRYRDDGVAPTTTVGQPLASGACITYSGPIPAVQFIAQTAGAILDVSYYR